MRPINRCINHQISQICQQMFQLEGLQSRVIPLLPENLRPFCEIASFNKGRLLLATTDAVWASQLRFFLPELRDKLRQEGLYQLSGIDIIIKKKWLETEKKAIKTTSILSLPARDAILAQSEHCNYEPLKQALKKLAGS